MEAIDKIYRWNNGSKEEWLWKIINNSQKKIYNLYMQL
jgi:hypothetical protein